MGTPRRPGLDGRIGSEKWVQFHKLANNSLVRGVGEITEGGIQQTIRIPQAFIYLILPACSPATATFRAAQNCPSDVHASGPVLSVTVLHATNVCEDPRYPASESLYVTVRVPFYCDTTWQTKPQPCHTPEWNEAIEIPVRDGANPGLAMHKVGFRGKGNGGGDSGYGNGNGNGRKGPLSGGDTCARANVVGALGDTFSVTTGCKRPENNGCLMHEGTLDKKGSTTRRNVPRISFTTLLRLAHCTATERQTSDACP